MKKFTLLAISFAMLQVTVFAQNKISLNKINYKSTTQVDGMQHKQRPKGFAPLQKTAVTACGKDTLDYVDYKTQSAFPLDLVGNGRGSYGEGLGQWFEGPQAVTIYGFSFYGRAKNNTNTSVNVSVYSANADSTPNTKLATTTTILNNTALTFAALQRNVTFATPVTVTGPYVIVVEAPAASNDTIQLIVNNDGNGQGERLSKVRALGTTWFDVMNSYGLDADFLAYPIVSYNISPRFTVSANPTVNRKVNFTNTSSPVYFSRFYNLAVLSSDTAASFLWTFGDGSADSSAVNNSHVYATAGTYNVILHSRLYGNTRNCDADTTGSIIVLANLPIKLAMFEARRNESTVAVTWTTATEQNSKGFELQRSADGQNFTSIAFINSKAIGGNSSSLINYEFNDLKPLTSGNYYRLKQVDNDNRSFLSTTVFIKGQKVSNLMLSSVFPNPANKVLKLIASAPANQKITLVVSDLTGKIVMKKSVEVVGGDNNLQIDVSQLLSGNYMIKAVCENGCETAVSRFVKQ